MKRALCMLLAAITLISLAGCEQGGSEQQGGGKVIEEFINCIAAEDYASAYALLSASSRNDTEEDKAKRVTQKQFTDRYVNIRKALGINKIEYADFTSSGGEILYSAAYTATYYSDHVGEMTNTFSAIALREGGEWKVEWSPAMIFPEMEWGDTVRVARLSAKRGEILADGEVVAKTAGAISVYAMPSKIDDRELFLQQTSRLLNMTEANIDKKLEKAYDDVAILKQYYSDQLADSIKEQLLQIDGIGIDEGKYLKVREYPQGKLLAHLVGYVGSVPGDTKEQLKEELDRLNEGRSEREGLYNSDSRVGRLGLELQYEKELRGKDGELIYICTADGRNRKTIYKLDAEDGYDIELSIDMGLQRRVEEVMDLTLYGDTTAGAVVVMNPKTGAINAMYSWPSYDINLFTRGISSSDYSALLNNKAKPMINRVTQGLYPPGSTMKAFTAACAIDNEVLDENYAFDESRIKKDYWTPTEYGQWIWTAIKRTHINYPISGPLNMRKALIHSDNIYFANAALLTGWDRFEEYMAKLGFTESIPFDINVARAQLKNEDSEIDAKMLADSGYGQAEILVTPLQLACMFSALANGGNVALPYVVEGLYKEDGIRYKRVKAHPDGCWKQGVISEHAIEVITPFLEDVTDPKINGTGRNLRAKGCTVAAKTGTAEIGSSKSREIAWFVGYRTGVSDEDARLVLVMLEVPADAAYSNLKFDIARPLLSME